MNEQRRNYRVQSWRADNAARVARGSLTLWFDDAAVAGGSATERTERRGAPCRYADRAMQRGLVIWEVLHWPLRTLTGFLDSLACWLGLALALSDYSTFSRRAGH